MSACRVSVKQLTKKEPVRDSQSKAASSQLPPDGVVGHAYVMSHRDHLPPWQVMVDRHHQVTLRLQALEPHANFGLTMVAGGYGIVD